MPDQSQIEILNLGVKEWNDWREENRTHLWKEAMELGLMDLDTPIDPLGYEKTPVDLSRVNLSGRKLTGIDFSKASLRNADLSKADLRHANLIRTDLSYSNLKDAVSSN